MLLSWVQGALKIHCLYPGGFLHQAMGSDLNFYIEINNGQ